MQFYVFSTRLRDSQNRVLLLLCVLVCALFAYWSAPALMASLQQKWNSFFENDKLCGVEASTNLIHNNPWLVFLEYYNGDDVISVRCAATLVGKKHVVTAAHCVLNAYYTRLKVRLGEYDLTSTRDCLNGICNEVVTINVTKIHPSPKYDGSGGDFAILELEKEAPYTDFIRPICLPTGQIEEQVQFVAAGWGEVYPTHTYSKVKKIIPLPSWKEADCKETYRHDTLPKDVICAGGSEGIDTCNGDSGGPLVLYRKRAELWGVTSLGTAKCGLAGYPGIYTSVKDHLDWINEAIKGEIGSEMKP